MVRLSRKKLLTGVFAGGLVATTLGAVVIFGWLNDIYPLVQIYPTFAAMQFNTALGFVLTGCGLFCTLKPTKIGIGLTTGLLILMTVTTLIEYASAVNLGIDQLFIEHKVTVKTSHPGRMSPNTALCFVVSGTAILLSGFGFFRHRALAVAMLGAIVSAFGLVVLIGYATELEATYGWVRFTRMALHTASGFTVVGAAIFTLGLLVGYRDKEIMPRWGALPVFFGAAVIVLSLSQAIAGQENREIQQAVETRTNLARTAFETRIGNQIVNFERIGRRWQRRGGTPEGEWRADVGDYLTADLTWRAIAWVAADGRDAWIEPRSGSGGLIGERPPQFPRLQEAIEQAKLSRQLVVTDAIETADGQFGLLVLVPLFKQQIFDSYILGEIGLSRLMGRTFSKLLGEGFRVRVMDGDVALFSQQNGSVLDERYLADLSFQLGDKEWRLEVNPARNWVQLRESWLPESVLFGGLSLVGLLYLAYYYAQIAKQREHILEVTNQWLATANDELEQFAYIASHDLQEPLRMIASFAGLLEKRHKDEFDETSRKYLTYVIDGALRMKTMLNGLLAYSRLGTGKPDKKVVDCNDVVADVLENLNLAVSESGMALKIESLPTIAADRDQMLRLFQNLIGNAVKFRAEENPSLEVVAQRKGDFWEFRVTDNGIGIDPAYKDQVFEIFQRLNPRGSYEGSGIGLALVKRIVEQHGGEITVESQLGLGTTFRFTMPTEDRLKAMQATGENLRYA